jgi:hypothetical protein
MMSNEEKDTRYNAVKLWEHVADVPGGVIESGNGLAPSEHVDLFKAALRARSSQSEPARRFLLSGVILRFRPVN